MAHKYLSVPATSAPSDRVLSAAGNGVEKLLAALTAENVDALVFLHKNAELLGLEQDVAQPSTAPRMLKTEKDVDKLEKVGALMEIEEEAEQGTNECEEVYRSPRLPRLP